MSDRPETTSLRVRPIAPADRGPLVELFERLSPESRRRRFHGVKKRLTSSELTYLTEIDHVGHEALAAVDERTGSIVAVARYAAWPDRPDTADLAVVVVDELQGRGIGSALAQLVVDRARASGIGRLTASTLPENLAARGVLRRLGFHARPGGGWELELEPQLLAPLAA